MISSDDSDNERMIYSFVTVEYQLKRLLSLVNAEHWKYLSPHLQKGRKIVWYKTLRKIFRKQRKKKKLQLFKANRTRKSSTFVTFWFKIIQKLLKGST